jgi:hypothetical protein
MCGLLIAVCAYWTRDADVPMPLFEIMLVIPCAALSGLLVARGGPVELGMAAGAATATTGHVTAVVAAVLYTATTGTWLSSLAWLLMGAALILVPTVVGATFGALGAVLARLVRPMRS